MTTKLIAGGAAAAAAVALTVGGQPAWATPVPVPVTTWGALQSAFAGGGTVQLGADITAPDDQNLVAGSTPVTLDLNGHDLEIDDSDDAGITAVEVDPAATLTIEDSAGGGVLDAQAGDNGAGIGGAAGAPGPGPSSAGSVTISGGTVYADGGEYAAGIGGGGNSSNSATTSLTSLVISGGTVVASGGEDAAGIGGDNDGPGGPVSVSAGRITAIGGTDAAGIGGGSEGAGGSLTMTGGRVRATGGDLGAGVGGGSEADGGPVTVNGGTLTAAGGFAPGIGGGNPFFFFPFGSGTGGAGGTVDIGSQGTVTATSDESDNAIGPGYGSGTFGSLSNAGTLTISSNSAENPPGGVTIDNSGTLRLNGTVNGSGAVHNTGSIVVGSTGSVIDNGDGQGGGTVVDTNSFDLSFDLNGEPGTQPDDEFVLADTVAASGQSLPALPTGATGWYTAASGGTQVTNATDLEALLGAGPLTETLYAQYAPTITGVSPSSGTGAGGTSVTITGVDLTGTSVVYFGSGAAAQSFTVDSDSQITATSPAHAAGTVNVRVVANHVQSAVSAADVYTFIGPVVGAASPAQGPTSGGTVVTLAGSDFSSGTPSVTVGGAAATNVSVLSNTRLRFTTPAGSVGPATVAVTNPDGTGSKAGDFTYVAAPTITSVSPSSGKTAGGTSITITGSGFTGTRAVNFGTTAAASFTVNSDSSLTVVSPAHAAGVVNVRVVATGGQSPVATADRFTFTTH